MKIFASALTLSALLLAVAPSSHANLSADAVMNEAVATTKRVDAAAGEMLYSLSLAENSVRSALQDRDYLKVCHSLGIVHFSTVLMANAVLNSGANTQMKIEANAMMPTLAELNTFCKVPANLAAWKPRSEIKTLDDVATRLETLRESIKKIRAEQPGVRVAQ